MDDDDDSLDSLEMPPAIFQWTMPRFGGYVSAAEYQDVLNRSKQIMACTKSSWTTELPKIEPYYSKCLQEYETMKAQVRSDSNYRMKTKKKATLRKKTTVSTRNKTKKKKNSRTAPPSLFNEAANPKPKSNADKPTIQNVPAPSPSFINVSPNHPTPPPNYPKPTRSVGKKIGNITIIESPDPVFCEHCKLIPCIVDAHMDELCERNAESHVLLCDPPDITYRKLSAFFRRLIVKYFGSEYMKNLGEIPICAQDQCHTMATRDDSEFEGFM